MISVDEVYEIISKNIKEYRKESKMTQAQLAEKSNLSDVFIRRIESRKCKKNFSIETIYLISLALSIPLEKLFVIKKERGCSMDKNLTFLEQNKAEFEEFVSHVSVDLEKTNLEYKKLADANSNILKKNPKLRDIIEEKKGHYLTQNECDMLATYIENTVDLTFLEYNKIFFKGFKEAYYYFKKSGLLDENNKIDDNTN